MQGITLVIVIAIVVGVAGLSAIAFVLLGGSGNKSAEMRELMSSGRRVDKFGNRVELDIDDVKKATGSSTSKKKTEDLSAKLFKAGYYTPDDRRRFVRMQIVAPIVSTIACTFVMIWLGNPLLIVTGVILGLFIGFAFPMSWLERQIRARQEEIMYYLPLVIEQISIGVSSALDIGPCISQIVAMAKERDSHNPITEMFVHVEKLLRSGLNLEGALIEVGEANGMTELKHAFMFLAQCSKHGGEVSKQLQELADAVMVQRQVQVEARISALPVKATGPLATVFAGFFALLFAGLFVRLLSAFGGGIG